MWRAEDWPLPAWGLKTPGPVEPMWMDARHVGFIYDLVMAGGFRSVLEIGCWHGYSSSALIQAINDGSDCEVLLCDKLVRPELLAVVDRCRFPERVRLAESDSIPVLGPQYDLVIVDGDHSIEQVSRELGLLLYYQTPTIVAHDVAQGLQHCVGSSYLGDALQLHPSYHCVVDCKRREGERTERGLMLATRNAELLERIKPLWNTMVER